MVSASVKSNGTVKTHGNGYYIVNRDSSRYAPRQVFTQNTE